MKNRTSIIFCRCSAQVIPDEKAEELATAFRKLRSNVFELRDLCAVSVHEKDLLESLLKKSERTIIVACYSRAVKNMISQTGIDCDNFETINFKELPTGEILQKIKEGYTIEEGKADYQIVKSSLDVPPWYPVIDKSRCILCGKCAKFCLFGVYKFNGKSLETVNPLACKNHCPACGRTCPTSAIIFPRLPENTPLAGAEPGDEKKATGDSSLFVMLNERNRNRKNIFRAGIVQQAEEERRKALEELKNTQNNSHD